MKDKSIVSCKQVEKCVSLSTGDCSSDNLVRVVKVEKLVRNARVGENGGRSVHAEKTSQEAERRIQSHMKSQKSGRTEENLQVMTRSSVHCGKRSRSSGKGSSRR